jgi:hypothetical protein
MAFLESIVETYWEIANGRCEKCSNTLVWYNRGRDGTGAWEAHHKDGNLKNDSPANLEILCWDCHSQTF